MKQEGLTSLNQVKRNRDSSDKAFIVMAAVCSSGKCQYKFIKFGSKASEKVRFDSLDRRKAFRARHACDTRPASPLTARRWSCDALWPLNSPPKTIKNT